MSASKILLTPCQERAYESLSGTGNVFLTGGAGSGKSFLVRYFLKDKSTKEFPVLASTGAAAVLVGGRTFHSFFGLGILEGGPEATIEKAARNRQVVRRLKKINGFIVDEVSMLSGVILATAEIICRRVRDSDEPWGGLRVIAVGDFAQLPPVERNSSAKSWAFQHPVWTWSGFKTEYLRTQTRCRDEEYMRILNKVREGNVTQEVVDYLNSKIVTGDQEFTGTRLFPRRDQTDHFNLKKLNELKTPLIKLETVYTGQARLVEQLKKVAPIPEVLHLKENALVMIRQNDPQGRWVNGTTGYVEKMSTEMGGMFVKALKIRLLNGRLAELEKQSFTLLDADGEVVASATNFPVSLAYASTIHKAQGATLDRLWVDLKQLWEPGQAYVALSRISQGSDLWVEAWQPRAIRTDPHVTQFYDDIAAH